MIGVAGEKETPQKKKKKVLRRRWRLQEKSSVRKSEKKFGLIERSGKVNEREEKSQTAGKKMC